MPTENTPIIISTTGVGRGWGSDPWKWVSGLTRDERVHVRDGTAVVLITDCPLSGGGNGTGTTLRQVRYTGRQYVHRVPADEILDEVVLCTGCGEYLPKADARYGDHADNYSGTTWHCDECFARSGVS